MAIDFLLPELGENIESADVVNVLVSEGDLIHANQSVVELETDKAVVEIPCPHAGKVAKIHVSKGQKIKVGQKLLTVQPVEAEMESPSSPLPAAVSTHARVAAATEAAAAGPALAEPSASAGQMAAPATPLSAAPPGSDAERLPSPTAAVASGQPEVIPAGPAARRLARQLGVDLRTVQGSGPRGRIRPEDVQAAAARQAGPAAGAVCPLAAAISPPGAALPKAAPGPVGAAPTAPSAQQTVSPWTPVVPPGVPGTDPWGPVRREPMPRIRRTIAAQMVRSVSTIPHVTNFEDADITDLESLRKSIPAGFLGPEVKLTLMPFLMKATALALRRHPVLNASLDMQPDNEQIIYKEYVNIGVAVDTPRGLVVPVVRNVDRMSIPDIARAVAEVAQRARTAQFTIEETRGGTFTISNLGAVGGTYSTPIINFPEVALLLAGRSRWMPVVRGEQIEKRLMLPLSLSYDHRLVDGAAAARFLNEVIDWLQNPGKLLLVS